MRPTALLTLVTLALAAAAASAASVAQLPVACTGRETVYGNIEPAGDVDPFTVFLAAGETLAVTSTEGRPEFGLLTTLKLRDPQGADVTPTVTGQGEKTASFQYFAVATGLHTLELTGDAGGFGGSTGNYVLTIAVTRLKPEGAAFADAAGGTISVPIAAPAGSTLAITAATKTGGFDLTELRRPDGTAEPLFAESLKAKNRLKAKLPKFALTGGPGVYELRGTYDAGSNVTVKVALKTNEKPRKRQLTYDEPKFEANGASFPGEGITGTVIFVSGNAFDDIPILKRRKEIGRRYPAFTIGGVVVPADTVTHPNGSIYSFPVPAGLAENGRFDIEAVNADGQTALIDDAFFVVPPPLATGLATDTAGKGGGRLVRILGSDLRPGASVTFGTTIAQADFTDPDYTFLDVIAPAHTPGTVSLEVRDRYGRTTPVPGTFTFLDVPFNRITSISPAMIQAVGGEKITVNGLDFEPETVLTLDRVEMDATHVSATKLEFVAPEHADADVQLRVTGNYEQTHFINVPIRGFSDITASAIPAPNTGSGTVDGWRATRVLAGDVTGDNKPDLILLRPEPAFGADADRSRIRLLVNGAGGVFTDATATKIPAVSADEDWRAKDGVLFDMDGDGDLDLAIITDEAIGDGSGGFRSSLRILRNNGTGTFTDATSTAVPALTSYGDRNQGVAIAAANVDGATGADLVIVNTAAFREEIVTPGGPPTQPPDPPPPPDIVTVYNYPATRVLANNGSGVFARRATALPAITDASVNKFEGAAVAVGDVTGGSGPDIVITLGLPIPDPANQGSYLRAATLLVNNGTGTFTDATAAKLPAASDPEFLQANRVYLTDVDGDADLDLALASASRLVSPTTEIVSASPAVRFFANNGTGTFTAVAAGQYPAADAEDSLQADAVVVADYTGDGRSDVFVVSAHAPNSGDRATRVLVRNLANAAWQRGSRGLPSPAGLDDLRGTDALAVDVDGDGDLDLVIVRDEATDVVRSTIVLKNPR
jgi:hypothetical protein